MAIWRIFRRSPLSEDKYPNRNPAWKQALLIIDFQVNTRKGSSTSLSGALSSDRITREIKSEAFYTESTVKLNSCRAGNCSIVPNSIATAFASKVSKVFATPNYVNWSLPVGTYDTNLPNNQWQTTEGTGGVVGSVLKQKVELKSKSIKL